MNIIVSDVDSCLTVDKKHFRVGSFKEKASGSVEVLFKPFNDKDSYIIEVLKKNNIDLILISGDSRINPEWANYKKLDFIMLLI